MTNETIAQIIDFVNSKAHDSVYFRMISKDVAFGRAWPRKPSGQGSSRGYDFFFVFLSDQCVGAVLDMGEQDLHCYTNPEHRRKGLMSRALSETILPFLAAQGRQQQLATLSNQEAKALVEKVGFEVNDRAASIDLARFEAQEFDDAAPMPLGQDRANSVKQQIRHAEEIVRMVSDEIGLAHTRESNIYEKLDAAASLLFDARIMIDDEEWDLSRQTQST